MSKQIEIGNKAKVLIDWHTQSIDYSREKEGNIIAKFAKKYGIPKENVSVRPKFIVKDANGNEKALTNEVVNNIQDPKFQQKLFLEYAEDNKLEGFDFEKIKEIDAEINSMIDYDVYDKYKRYEVKWIKWSNFLSYGPDNYVDFTKLHGLVHLTGEPANQSGKSTFAYDLLHFLLFGKPSSDRADMLSKIFNNHLPEAKECSVEGCLNIDGKDYIIKRVLKRPELKRRSDKSKVTQTISYYKIENGVETELADIDNLEGESGTETNKIIKEAIGKREDFDLVISANADNLKSLISLKDTERGRLLSRWIGLLPLEAKDKLARETWNSKKSKFVSNVYNRETLKSEIEEYEGDIKDNQALISSKGTEIKSLENEITSLGEQRETLLSSMNTIDPTIVGVDVSSVENNLVRITEEGKRKAAEKKKLQEEVDNIKDVEYSENEYISLNEEFQGYISKITECKTKKDMLEKNNIMLKKSEFCPTCGRKFENVDNSQKIADNEVEIKNLEESAKDYEQKKSDIKIKLDSLLENKNILSKKDKAVLTISALDIQIENLRLKYKQENEKKKKYYQNEEAISKNNRIQLQAKNLQTTIAEKNRQKEELLRECARLENINSTYEKTINEKKGLINQIAVEEEITKNWLTYLKMVGKDGIGKMVLRQTLPIINSELARLLDGVCDFTVEVAIDDKNDISFNLIRDGVSAALSSGSGYEQTAAAIALRAVLSKISMMPKPSFILFDEVLGGVARENYENISKLYKRILMDYSFIFHICHTDFMEDSYSATVMIKKENNISRVLDFC